MRLGESLVYGLAPNSSHPVSPVPITGAFCFWTKEMQNYHSVGDSRCICELKCAVGCSCLVGQSVDVQDQLREL